jgi:hypothetical protein
LRLEFDLDRPVGEVATRVAAEQAERTASQARAPIPWMAMQDAIAYSRIPAGTFRQLGGRRRIRAHGGRRKLFHRDEPTAALEYRDPRRCRLRAATWREGLMRDDGLGRR